VSLSVVGRAEVVPFSATANPSHPGACVLPDDTVLIAWQNLDTGVVTVQHRTRTLTLIAETTTPAPLDLAFAGLALLHSGGVTRLILSAGSTWTVDTNPLTLSPGPSVPLLEWGMGASSVLTVGETTVAAAYDQLVVTTPVGVRVIPTPNVVTNVARDGDHVLVGVMRTTPSTSTPDDVNVVDAYRLDLSTGSLSLASTGPYQEAPTFPGVTTGQAWAAFEWDGASERLVVRDPAGTVTAEPGWPTSVRMAEGYVGSTPTHAGLLTAWAHRIPFQEGAIGLVHLTGQSADVLDLDLSEWPGYRSAFRSLAPVLATNGRTTVLVRTALLYGQDTGRPDEYGITAWMVDLSRHAQLRVALVQGDGHPWSSRLVGDESWEHGPGRMKIGDPNSPSGWFMEVKPGDDTSNATWVRLDLADGRAAAFRVVPWPGRP